MDEKDKVIKDLVNQQSVYGAVKNHLDTNELMKNQLQQYASGFETERGVAERFVQQMIELQTSVRQKEEEIKSLQNLLAKYGNSLLKLTTDVSQQPAKHCTAIQNKFMCKSYLI